MRKREAEQKWWSALCNWLVKYQGRADYLFVYDAKHGRLDRCFERNVSLSSVDDDTVSKLYQAAAEGRLGLLRPKDLKPQLLTADPAKMFSSGKEVYVAQDRSRQQEVVKEKNVEDAVFELDEQELEHTVADPVVAERLHAAEMEYRQAEYTPRKQTTPASETVFIDEMAPTAEEKEERSADSEHAAADPVAVGHLHTAAEVGRQVEYTLQKQVTSASVEVSENEKTPAAKKEERSADLERAAEIVRTTVSLQLDEGFHREQEQLIADLVQMVLNIGNTEQQDTEQLERKRKAREKLVAAQNMFIWSAVKDKRERKVRMEWLDQKVKRFTVPEVQYREWKRQMVDISRELYSMDQAGVSEQDCSQKIRDYLDGKRPVRQTEKAKSEEEVWKEEPELPGEMWGNTLRHFCRFAASEIPLSVRHVQVAKHCWKIVQEAERMGFGPNELGLNPQEQAAVKGTIEMGVLVERGLLAQEALASGRQFSGKHHRAYLRDFLAMKGIEAALIPHVQAHQEEINTGDGPLSAMQILMAHKGFLADDLREKTGKTGALTHLERMDRQQVARMILQGSNELVVLGQQVMVSNYQENRVLQTERQHLRQTQLPQKGGPVR